jgi:hypothetical protein
MKTIPVATFDTLTQAEPLRRRLMDSHITAWVREGSPLKRLWFLKRPKAEVKLEVRAKDFDKSLRLLHALENKKATPARMVRCPECHSSRVEFPQFTRKFFLPNLIGLLAGLGLVEKKYYCEDCHNTWLPRSHKPHKERAHMAPNYFLENLPRNKN